jgi:tRNA threonylcarbamoyladenosine modification (KEOPS) complex  Pcc1 subunit
MKMNLELPFDDRRHAEIAYNSLRVDSEPKRSGMKKTLVLKDNVLCAEFVCQEARTLRVSVNNFLDLLILVTKTMDQFDN